MNKINTVGVDLAKNVFHLCAQDQSGIFSTRKNLAEVRLSTFSLPQH